MEDKPSSRREERLPAVSVPPIEHIIQFSSFTINFIQLPLLPSQR